MSGIDPISLAVTGLTTLASLKQASDQRRAQADAHAQAARTAEDRRQHILETQQVEETRERERLRRELARRRARFGARGIGADGSAAALLAGLSRSSERRMAEDRRLDGRRLGRIAATAQPRSLFDDRLGLAAGLLEQSAPHLRRISLFDAPPSRASTSR